MFPINNYLNNDFDDTWYSQEEFLLVDFVNNFTNNVASMKPHESVKLKKRTVSMLWNFSKQT